MNEDNKTFLEKTKTEFDHSVESIDAATASKITQARHQALDKANKRKFYILNWLPVSAMASACLAIIIFMALPDQNAEQAIMQDDMDLISSSEELELYEELEFYEWLEDYELPS